MRLEVPTCTYWKAPIIWEGMFDPTVFDQTHAEHGSSVALTVFAVGRLVPHQIKLSCGIRTFGWEPS